MVGHINHSLFWKNLAPAGEAGGKLPSGGSLEKALVKEFGSVEEFKKKMNAVTGAIQGSGWGWLVCSFFRRRLNGLLIYCSYRRDITRPRANSRLLPLPTKTLSSVRPTISCR